MGRGETAVFTTLGANNHVPYDRAKNDYYATDPIALEKFLDKIQQDKISLNNNIWECCCGEGNLSKVLKNRGYNVYSTDLINRNYGEDFFDLFSCDKKFNGDILTNPPYTKALSFVEKTLELIENESLAIHLLKVQFLEGKSRYKFYQENPPKYIYVHSSRVACYRNNIKTNTGSAICYAWYIWQKGYKGDTIVRWIK